MDTKANKDVLHEGRNIVTEEYRRGYIDSARIITLRESESDSEYEGANIEDSGIADDDMEGKIGSESDVQDTPQSPSSERETLPSSEDDHEENAPLEDDHEENALLEDDHEENAPLEEDHEENVPLDVIWGRRGDPPHQVKTEKKFLVQ